MTTSASRALRLYSIFHLNLAYSSIEEAQRGEVVKRCYRPLLNLARELEVPIGVELTGFTLEAAARLDPEWEPELRALIEAGRVEIIGSGYAQLIGPLVPAEVNRANLRLGHEVYERRLGLRPTTALINEQAFSSGLIAHYVEAGYKAVVMEWDNPARQHPDWDPQWRYYPQRALGPGGEKIALIWNKSIAFQKFQRHAHGEMELGEYLAYLAGHVGNDDRAFPLYGNDAEIFNFRPGRFETEAELQEDEWARIAALFRALKADGRFEFVLPRQVLGLMEHPKAGHTLHLDSPEQPIPVKKQGKYNILRWAVAGRDDVAANTGCWRAYRALKAKPAASDDYWRELCYLWSSDFRTHITPTRWSAYRKELADFGQSLGARNGQRHEAATKPLELPREGRYVTIEAGRTRVRLNCRRGLAVDGLWLGSFDGPPLCGTLHHGFYDDISLGADWYTGHCVFEAAGEPRATDLNPVEPSIVREDNGDVVVRGEIKTPRGPVRKIVRVSAKEPRVTMDAYFDWPPLGLASFRLGHVTLHPLAFDRKTLYYRTCNGGAPERWALAGKVVNHGDPVSFLVSARGGVGLTEGWVEFGDDKRALRVEVDQACAALIGLIAYRETSGTYFCRLALSGGELDDTRRADPQAAPIHSRVSLTLA